MMDPMKHTLGKINLGSYEIGFMVANEAGQILGMISKPKDTRGDKNAWRAYRGIGPGQTFLGHSWSKTGAAGVVCGTASPLPSVSPRRPNETAHGYAARIADTLGE